ncbi:unnamed protein product [Peniophora sp. CBMAI 1063]|nr:unnamed protein product [Peniophora sp. CBMAI 1063]
MPLTYRGYSVMVKVDGEELPQFQVEKTDERTITCWMPSEAGKTFLVHTTTTTPHEHEYKSVRVFADGRKLQGFANEDDYEQTVQYRVSSTSREPFMFSEVAFELADEDHSVHDNHSVTEDIGVIEVQIWQSRRSEKPYNIKHQATRPHAADAGIKLSEKSKLIGANHVKPGIPEPYLWKSGTISTQRIGRHPYAVFRFKHRPKALLQAMGVMPRPVRAPTPPTITPPQRTRSPGPQEASNKRRRIDNDADEDVKPILGGVEDADARRRRIEERMAALQAELAGLDSQEPANVKAERAPSPITVPQHGEVIDLTLDD